MPDASPWDAAPKTQFTITSWLVSRLRRTVKIADSCSSADVSSTVISGMMSLSMIHPVAVGSPIVAFPVSTLVNCNSNVSSSSWRVVSSSVVTSTVVDVSPAPNVTEPVRSA